MVKDENPGAGTGRNGEVDADLRNHRGSNLGHLHLWLVVAIFLFPANLDSPPPDPQNRTIRSVFG